jgi:hypothetical protein
MEGTNGGGPLVLTMGWINSLTFCAMSETCDIANAACTGATHLPTAGTLGVNPTPSFLVIFRRSSTDLPSAAEESTDDQPYGHRPHGPATDDPRKREE